MRAACFFPFITTVAAACAGGRFSLAVRWQIPSRIKPSPGQSQPIQLKDGLAVDTKGRPRGTPEVVWLWRAWWRGVVFGPFLLGTVVHAVVVATMVATSLYRKTFPRNFLFACLFIKFSYIFLNLFLATTTTAKLSFARKTLREPTLVITDERHFRGAHRGGGGLAWPGRRPTRLGLTVRRAGGAVNEVSTPAAQNESRPRWREQARCLSRSPATCCYQQLAFPRLLKVRTNASSHPRTALQRASVGLASNGRSGVAKPCMDTVAIAVAVRGARRLRLQHWPSQFQKPRRSRQFHLIRPPRQKARHRAST